MEIPFDDTKFISEKSKYSRNHFTLKINAKGALYDTTVKEIHFFNYEVLSQEISLKNRNRVWWLSDRLTDHGDHYILEIDLQDFDSDPEEFTFIIKFEQIKVDREK
ncbi:MAG: hypothetical protein IJB19_02445 [Clostridia bacterium]|nr:hypothetical protein [Clostridia bacterium]